MKERVGRIERGRKMVGRVSIITANIERKDVCVCVRVCVYVCVCMCVCVWVRAEDSLWQLS